MSNNEHSLYASEQGFSMNFASKIRAFYNGFIMVV